MIGVHGDLGLRALSAVNELVRTELGWDPREAEAQASEYWHAARCITAVTA